MAPSPLKTEGSRALEAALNNEEALVDIQGKEDNNERKPDLYTKLVTEAPYVKGDENDLVPIEEIKWVDKSLIEHSMHFHRKYLTFVVLSNTFALMYGFAVKPNSAVLIRTGKLHVPELSFHRYLSTMQRIGKFFMIHVNKEKSYKPFDTVRKMHVMASKKRSKVDQPQQSPYLGNETLREPWKTELALAMRKDLAHIDTSTAPKDILTWDPEVPVSQFDMALTQFGFIGTMWLFPRIFGIRDRMEEMKGVIHTWAIFGRLLGIRDEFNVCINPDPVLFDKLFKNIVLESLKSMDETVVTIQSAFADAFTKRVPFMTYKAMLVLGLQEMEGYTGEHLWKLMSWTDKLSLFIIRIWAWSIRTSMLCSIISNILTMIWMQIQFWLNLQTSLWDK